MAKEKKKIAIKEVVWFLIRILIIILFVGVSFIGSGFHERWADEAQAWLLARDASLTELFFKYASMEGSPVLWHVILKIGILLGLEYSHFWIIPTVFSIIGLIILEFKLKLPWYLKLFLPFTYYILYQYTVVARSYNLLFPVLCYLAMYYPKRKEKPIFYGVGLCFLAGISAHGSLISGTLFLLFVGEIVSDVWKKEKSLKSLFQNKKMLFTILLTTSVYLFILLTIVPNIEIVGHTTVNPYHWTKRIVHIMGQATISTREESFLLCFLGMLGAIAITTVLGVCNKKDRKITLVLFPILGFLVFYYCNKWHIGIFTEVLFFVWYILGLEFENKASVIEKIFICGSILMILLIQIFWSIRTLSFDQKEMYAQGENAAKYLQEFREKGAKIYAVDYSVTAILPYFEENIFDNHPERQKSFFHWGGDRSGRRDSEEELKQAKADVYVYSKYYYYCRLESIGFLKNKGYQEIEIPSFTYVKNSPYEHSGYIFLISPNLAGVN